MAERGKVCFAAALRQRAQIVAGKGQQTLVGHGGGFGHFMLEQRSVFLETDRGLHKQCIDRFRAQTHAARRLDIQPRHAVSDRLKERNIAAGRGSVPFRLQSVQGVFGRRNEVAAGEGGLIDQLGAVGRLHLGIALSMGAKKRAQHGKNPFIIIWVRRSGVRIRITFWFSIAFRTKTVNAKTKPRRSPCDPQKTPQNHRTLLIRAAKCVIIIT